MSSIFHANSFSVGCMPFGIRDKTHFPVAYRRVARLWHCLYLSCISVDLQAAVNAYIMNLKLCIPTTLIVCISTVCCTVLPREPSKTFSPMVSIKAKAIFCFECLKLGGTIIKTFKTLMWVLF